MLRGENIFPKNMISRGPVYIIYVKTDSTVKNREYAFAKTFESVFDEDTFFNSCLQVPRNKLLFQALIHYEQAWKLLCEG